MSEYRIYTLDELGRLSFPEELSASSDQQALEVTRQMNFRKCEIWRGRWLVASADANDLPPQAKSSPEARFVTALDNDLSV